MHPQRAEQIAKLLDQTLDAFSFLAVALLPSNQGRTVADIMAENQSENSYGTVAFGFSALALVYAFDCVAVPLKYPVNITAEIDITALGVTQNDPAKRDNSNLQVACFRHLRNCFAHGNFSYNVVGDVTTIVMIDKYDDGTITFQASCEVQEVTTVAARVLSKAFDVVAAPAP